MEQNRNVGPRHAIRLSDLCEFHIVIATCPRCRRQTDITPGFLTWDRAPGTLLVELQRKLYCTHCGNRKGNTLSVRMAPRN